MFIFGWLIAGLLGNFIVWRVHTNIDFPKRRCPTPKAIFAIIVGCPLGGVTLLMGTAILIVEWLEAKPKTDSWWTRPICPDRE